MDGLGRVISLILLGILVSLLPLRALIINHENLMESYVHEQTVKFADKVMDQGHMTIEMYEEYINLLNPSKNIYEIELIHSFLKEGQESVNIKNKRDWLDGEINMIPVIQKENIIIGFDVNIIDKVIEKGQDIKAYLTIIYSDGQSRVIDEGFEYDLNSNILGTREVTFCYEGLEEKEIVSVVEKHRCPICKESYILDSEDAPGCSQCNHRILEIEVDSDFYTVSLGEELVMEVTAIYQGGKTEIVDGWISNFNPNEAGLQEVIVKYGDMTASTKVFVESGIDMTCADCGQIYSKVEYPHFCPFCSKTVIGIETSLQNASKIKLGSDLNLSIILIYYDGQRIITKESYDVFGFEPNKLGKQNIKVRYKDFETSLLIEVVEHMNTNLCDMGHAYFLDLDGTDQGCPLCNDPSLGGEITNTYQDRIYTSDILKELYTNEVYKFNDGDYFTVKVLVNNRESSSLIRFVLLSDKEFKYKYGGRVYGKSF